MDNKLWKELQGGYKIDYDASIPLRQLEEAKDEEEVKKIYDELWNELHHQGDVGLASYLALPQLVRIAKAKGLFDSNVLGLCSVIEQQRHLGHNPPLPQEYMDALELQRRVRLELEPDHIGVWPDKQNREQNGD